MSKKKKLPKPKGTRHIKLPLTSEREAADQLADLRKKMGWKGSYRPHETGTEVQEDLTTTVPDPKGWPIKPHFCPECGNTAVVHKKGLDDKPRYPAPSLWICNEPRPDLQLTVGDIIYYYTCPDCTYRAAYGKRHGIWLPDGSWHASEEDYEANTAQRLFDYIRARILAGESPIRGSERKYDS